jgi:hypothetical protein
MNLVSIMSDNGEMNVKLPCSSGCWLAWASGWTYICHEELSTFLPTLSRWGTWQLGFIGRFPDVFFEIKRKQKNTQNLREKPRYSSQIWSGMGFPPQNLIVFQCFFLKAGLPMTISLDHVIGDFTTSAFLVHTFAWNEVGVIPVYPRNGQVS